MEKKEMTKKTEKTFSAKKLPSLFKKTYEEEKFSKKILDRLYIQKDKDDVAKLFVKGASQKYPERLAVSKDETFTKAQLKRFKTIAKEIQENAKFRFAVLPFAATGIFLAALVIVISVFKNPLVKKGIKSACEGIFEAKTDVQYVDLSILNSTLTINGLAIGNKDDVFKNLFEAEKVELAFNLTQLLRGKFICKNIECSGMKFGTDRETSCELPKKIKKPSEESAFSKELKARSKKALEDLKAQAEEFAGGSDVDSIVENYTSQLKTPAIAQEAKKAAEEMTQKWKEKPAELKTQIETFSSSVKDLQSLNTSSLSDPVKIKDAITKIDSALKQSEKIKSSFDGTMESFKTDSSSVTGLSKQLTDALKEDKAFISSEMGKFAGVVKNPSELIGNAVSSVGYNMLGKYYPYAQKLLDLALEAKRTAAAQNKTAKPQKEKQESKRKRMEGTTFWYASDYPGFLIERIYASGPDFEGTVLELSSNPDIRNKPATADVKFRLKDIDHNGKLTVDARSETSAPLIAASYSGKGFDAAINGEKISSGSGIPSISGKTSLYFDAQGGTDGFTVSGGVDVNPAVLTSDGFSNETLSKYYITALSSIKKVALKFTAGFNEKEGLVFDINGNLTEAFTNAFTAAAKEAVGDAGKLAAAKLNEKINSANSESVAKIKDFLGIQNDFDVQNASLKNLQSQLETKKKELEAKASGKAKDAASGALEKAGVNTKAAGKATDKAADKLKKLF